MAKKNALKVAAVSDDQTVEQRIRSAAKECGITPEDCVTQVESHGAGVQAFGDGKFLEKFKKFLELLKVVLPIIIPIIMSEESTRSTEETVD